MHRAPCCSRSAGGIRQVHLAPVLQALLDRPRRVLLALDLDEAARLTHARSLRPARAPPTGSRTRRPLPRHPRPPPLGPHAPALPARPARPARACTRAASPSPAGCWSAVQSLSSPSAYVLPVTATCFMIAFCTKSISDGLDERLEIHHLAVAAAGEVAVHVQHVGDAAAHAGREVPAGAPQNHHAPARHVLAPVVADALDHDHARRCCGRRIARRPRRARTPRRWSRRRRPRCRG